MNPDLQFQLHQRRTNTVDFDAPKEATWSPDYSSTIIPKKRCLKVKKPTEIVLGPELEEGEVEENGMTEQDKKACKELYGDL